MSEQKGAIPPQSDEIASTEELQRTADASVQCSFGAGETMEVGTTPHETTQETAAAESAAFFDPAARPGLLFRAPTAAQAQAQPFAKVVSGASPQPTATTPVVSTVSTPEDEQVNVLQPGQMLEHFKIKRLIGRGGMSDVYLARDLRLGRQVAIKLIRREHVGSFEAVKRFLQEARATARFNHPNIVYIYGVGQYQESPYVALEFLQGENLRERMEEQVLTYKEALRVGIAVCEALQEAHAHHVLHCDLKPENILLPRDGRLRVVDFGLARVLGSLAEQQARQQEATTKSEDEGGGAEQQDKPQAPNSDEDPSLVTTLRGTPFYMAPEQWQLGASLSPATDLWAVGVMLYELLSGERPFMAGSLPELRFVVCGSQAPEPLQGQYPKALTRVVLRCLEKRPGDRPSLDALLSVLRDAVQSEHTQLNEEQGPFRGLQAFREQDAHLFHGRDDEVNAFLEKLRRYAILPVVGPSGAGKSSFVFAGVVPRLLEQEQWLVLRMRPNNEPFRVLAGRILSTLSPMSTQSEHMLQESTASLETEETLAAQLIERPRLLSLILQRLAEEQGKRVLLVVDQMEELITLVPDLEIRRLFVAALRWAAEDPQDPVRLIFTLRDDYLGRFAESAEAQQMLSYVTILRIPDAEALRQILTRPVRALGYRYSSPALVTQMIQEVEGEASGLPLLQFACQILWDRRDREQKSLLSSVYEEIGGVGGALSEHADGVLATLPASQQQAARRLLLRLVTPEQTRRVVSRDAVLDGLGDGGQQALDRLIQARLLASRQRKRGHRTGHREVLIELVHESLVQRWGTLRQWIEDSRDELAYLQQLSQIAEMWEGRGRRDAEVWRGEALQEALQFRERSRAKLPQVVTDFIDAGSVLERNRKQARQLLWGSSIAALLLIVLGSLFFAYTLRQKNQEVSRQWAMSQQEAAKMALSREEHLKSKAHLRAALEQHDSPALRAFWRRLHHAPILWKRKFEVPLESVAFAPNLPWVAVGGKRGRLLLLHLHTGQQYPLLGHQKAVVSLAFSRDGRWLASGDGDGQIKLWERTKQGYKACGKAYRQHKNPVVGLAFHPKGAMLVSSGFARSWVWRRQGKRLSAESRFRLGAARAVAFSLDGQWLALAGYRSTIRLWHVPSRRRMQMRDVNGNVYRLAFHVYHVAFGPKGRWLASAGADKTVMLWDIKKRRWAKSLRKHTNMVTSVTFGPHGRWLASASHDKTVMLWDLRQLRLARVLRGHTNMVQSLAFGTRGQWLASVGYDRMLRIWRVVQQERRAARSHRDSVRRLSFGPRGRWLASGSDDTTIRLWDVKRGRSVKVLRGHQNSLKDVAISPDGQRIGSIGRDDTIRLWDISTGQETHLFRDYLPLLFRFPFSPFGSHTAMVRGPYIYVRNVNREGQVQRLLATDYRSRIFGVSFAPDGRTFASVSSDQVLRLWRLGQAQPVKTLRMPVRQSDLLFSANSRLLATSGARSTILIWDLDKGVLLHRLLGHRDYITSIAFDPLGKRLVSSSLDGTVRLWDVYTGQSQILGRHPKRQFRRVVYRPDGNQIAAASYERSLHLWDMPSGKEKIIHTPFGVVTDLQYSPYSRYFAFGSTDGTLRVWDARQIRPYWRMMAYFPQSDFLLSHRGWQPIFESQAAETPLRHKRAAARGGTAQQLRSLLTFGCPTKATSRPTTVPKAPCTPRWRKALETKAWRSWTSPKERFIAILGQKQSFSLWDRRQDKRIYHFTCPNLQSVRFLPNGAMLLQQSGKLWHISRTGTRKVIATKVRTFFLDKMGLWVAYERSFVRFSWPTQQRIKAWSLPASPSVMLRRGPWMGVGFASGQFRWFQVKATKRRFPASLKSLPFGTITHIVAGPKGTIILGSNNGDLGIWDPRTGERLEFIRLHGPIQQLSLHHKHLIAITALGSFLRWDLDAYFTPYCQFLRRVWRRSPLLWERGKIRVEPPPHKHRCLATRVEAKSRP